MLIRKYFWIVLIACSGLSSCLEINEETEIKTDGSGVVTSYMDMSQLIDMMESMGGDEFAQKKNEKIDSTINFKDIIDTLKDVTEDEKKLMRNAVAHVKMDISKKVFNMSIKYPFSSIDNLKDLYKAMSNGKVGFGKLMNGAMGGGDEDSGDDAGPDMSALMGVFDFDVKNGMIEKKLDKSKYDKLNDDSKLAEMKQGADMGINVVYKTIYKLPRPLKKIDNKKAVVSADKMTVTLENNLLDIFSKPEDFVFKIEY